MEDERNNKCHFCNVIFKRHYNLKVHLKEQRCKSNLLNDWYKLNTILNKKDILVTTYQNQIKDHLHHDINEFTKNTNQKLTDDFKILLKNEIVDELKEKIKSEIDEKSINKYKKEVEQNVKKNMKNIVLRKYKKNENNIVTGKRGRPKKQKVIDILTESEKIENVVVNETTQDDTINNEDNTSNIRINPISTLNLIDNSYHNKKLITKYENCKANDYISIELFLNDYIQNLIYNKNIPENLCIKYIKKKPPTYKIKILDENNNSTYIIKRLHECSVVLYEPICKIIKKQLKLSLNKNIKYSDEDPEYSNETIYDIIKYLSHSKWTIIIKRVIKSILYSILFDQEMKTHN